MSLASEIERIQNEPSRVSEDFRLQLEWVRSTRERMTGKDRDREIDSDRGMDRSRNLNPISRPTIVRTLVES